MDNKKVYIDKKTKMTIMSRYESGDGIEEIAKAVDRPEKVVKNVLQRNEVYDIPISESFMKKHGHKWDMTRMMVRRAAGWS